MNLLQYIKSWFKVEHEDEHTYMYDHPVNDLTCPDYKVKDEKEKSSCGTVPSGTNG